MSKDLVNLKK